MRQANLLILNTGILFARMLVTFGVGLYVTRLVVQLLGLSDFGLAAALGAGGAFLAFVREALATSAQRYLAHEIGRADSERLASVFNTTLALFGALGVGICVLGWLVGPLLLSALEIPAGREAAAVRVFHVTLLTLAATSLFTPFRAITAAHQAMGLIAVFDILRTLLHLGVALAVGVLGGDSLVLYVELVLATTLVRGALFSAISIARYPEALPRPALVRGREVSRIARFTGWATLLGMGVRLHDQAAIVLLGVAFSPIVTAAYAIAMQVGTYHQNFCRVFGKVAQPAMTTREASGDRHYVTSLALLTGKYSALGILFLVVPVAIETDALLGLWLTEVPPQTASFVRLALVWMTLHVLSTGLERGAFAQGELARYSCIATALWVASLLMMSFFVFGLGLGPAAVPWTVLGITVAQLGVRIRYAGSLIGLGARDFFAGTLRPVLLVLGPGLAAAYAVRAAADPGAQRILAVALAYAVVAAPLIWWVALEAREKRVLSGIASSALPSLRRRFGGTEGDEIA